MWEDYKEYARKMDQFVYGPTTTYFEQLVADGIELPEPGAISDAEISRKLWEVIAGLAQRRVMLDYILPRTPDYMPPKALEWLRAHSSAHAFAGNRFPTTADAIAFVEQLFAAGATDVTIDNINLYPSHDWLPYADTLMVSLPVDHSKRHDIFELIEHVGRPDEDAGELPSDQGQHVVRLWWD